MRIITTYSKLLPEGGAKDKWERYVADNNLSVVVIYVCVYVRVNLNAHVTRLFNFILRLDFRIISFLGSFVIFYLAKSHK